MLGASALRRRPWRPGRRRPPDTGHRMSLSSSVKSHEGNSRCNGWTLSLGMGRPRCSSRSASARRTVGSPSCIVDQMAYPWRFASAVRGRQPYRNGQATSRAAIFAVRAGPRARNVGAIIMRRLLVGQVPANTRPAQCSGFRSAYSTATKPPIECPSTAARSIPSFGAYGRDVGTEPIAACKSSGPRVRLRRCRDSRGTPARTCRSAHRDRRRDTGDRWPDRRHMRSPADPAHGGDTRVGCHRPS